MYAIVLARQENPQCFLLTKAILLATIGPPRKGECKGKKESLTSQWSQIHRHECVSFMRSYMIQGSCDFKSIFICLQIIKLAVIDLSQVFDLLFLPPAKRPQWVHPTGQKVILFYELLQEVHAWSTAKTTS